VTDARMQYAVTVLVISFVMGLALGVFMGSV
jgi:hypothetical protein